MQPINPNTLFSIFEAGDEQIYQEHGITGVLNNPYVLMGMVTKGIENYHIMDLMYMRQYPKEYTNVREMTKLKYLNRLYGYLTKIDLKENNGEYRVGESYEIISVKSALEYMMFFYQELEYYEKCAVIKKYITYLESQTKLTLI